jgi:hypothetical protein
MILLYKQRLEVSVWCKKFVIGNLYFVHFLLSVCPTLFIVLCNMSRYSTKAIDRGAFKSSESWVTAIKHIRNVKAKFALFSKMT